MKPYRSKFPAWQPINEQIRIHRSKPSCFGHRRDPAILCGRCVWSDECGATDQHPTANKATDEHPTANKEHPTSK